MARFGLNLVSLLFLSFALRGTAGAASPSRDLETIRQKIEREKRGLSQLQLKEGSVLESLGKIQAELDRRTKELRTASAKFATVASDLALKETAARSLNESIVSREAILNKRAAALYRWYKTGSPLVVFNGDMSATAFFRRRKYLETAVVFDRELLANLREDSEHEEVLREELAQKKAELEEQKKALSLANDAVRREAEKKKLLLASLRREKTTRLKFLREMEAAAARLERMMEEISKRALSKPRGAPSTRTPGAGLEALRGKLDWPVRGQVTAPFGKFKHPEFATEIVRKGIDIDAPVGEEVRAVEKGTVVYAERFAGYGKMVIIDHGERYYTIYGHLSEILTKTGDQIGRGAIVGRAGDSDSLAGSKLYFEMRKDGHSLDPVPWFRKQ